MIKNDNQVITLTVKEFKKRKLKEFEYNRKEQQNKQINNTKTTYSIRNIQKNKMYGLSFFYKYTDTQLSLSLSPSFIVKNKQDIF